MNDADTYVGGVEEALAHLAINYNAWVTSNLLNGYDSEDIYAELHTQLRRGELIIVEEYSSINTKDH